VSSRTKLDGSTIDIKREWIGHLGGSSIENEEDGRAGKGVQRKAIKRREACRLGGNYVPLTS